MGLSAATLSSQRLGLAASHSSERSAMSLFSALNDVLTHLSTSDERLVYQSRWRHTRRGDIRRILSFRGREIVPCSMQLACKA